MTIPATTAAAAYRAPLSARSAIADRRAARANRSATPPSTPSLRSRTRRLRRGRAFGKGCGERGVLRLDHAPFGDERGDKPRRRHVKGIIGDRRALRHHAHRLDAPVLGAPRHGRLFLSIALFDRNLREAVGYGEIDRR